MNYISDVANILDQMQINVETMIAETNEAHTLLDTIKPFTLTIPEIPVFKKSPGIVKFVRDARNKYLYYWSIEKMGEVIGFIAIIAANNRYYHVQGEMYKKRVLYRNVPEYKLSHALHKFLIEELCVKNKISDLFEYKPA